MPSRGGVPVNRIPEVVRWNVFLHWSSYPMLQLILKETLALGLSYLRDCEEEYRCSDGILSALPLSSCGSLCDFIIKWTVPSCSCFDYSEGP